MPTVYESLVALGEALPCLPEEAEFLIQCFSELKAMDNAELRIAVNKDHGSGEVEIIFAGFHKKKSIDSVRRVYDRRRRGGRRGPLGTPMGSPPASAARVQ